MKKTLFISLAILLICGMALAAPGNETSPGHGDKLGQGGMPSDPGRIFRLVRYVPRAAGPDAATLAAESIVIWDCTSDDGVTVTETTTSYDSAVAGIIKWAALTPDAVRTVTADIGERNWTWLQTYGLAQVRVSAVGDVVVKEAMACSETAGEAADLISSTNPLLVGNAGFFMDTAAKAADNVDCFLNID